MENGALLDEKKTPRRDPKWLNIWWNFNCFWAFRRASGNRHCKRLDTKISLWQNPLFRFRGVTTPDQGLLSDRKDFYLTRGYANNDRVGKSYLEYQYEDYLNSHKEKVEYVEDNKGNVVSQKPLIKAAGDTIFSFPLTWSFKQRWKRLLKKKWETAVPAEITCWTEPLP